MEQLELKTGHLSQHFGSRVGSNLSISQSLRRNHRLSGSKSHETNLALQKLSSSMAAKLTYLASPKVSHLSTKPATRLNANIQRHGAGMALSGGKCVWCGALVVDETDPATPYS